MEEPTVRQSQGNHPASGNDPAAALVQRWMKPLYGFALNRTGRMDEAEELAARMVEGLYRSLLRHGIPDHPPSYVWRLASNHWARWLRDRSRQPGQESFDEAAHSGTGMTDPASGMIREETLGLLRREVAWLSRIQRQVVIRHYFESRPLAKIARDLAMPVGTIKWHLSAAREELRKGMEIMRTVGELGMKPVEFKGGVWINGDPGKEKSLEQLNRRLCQNIVYACYHQDRTLEEIAGELGVSPVFLADEVQSLAEAGILERRKAGRYRAEILIMEWTHALVQSVTRLYKDHAPVLSGQIFKLLSGMEAHFAASGITWPDQDWNTLLWTLIPLWISKKIPLDDHSGPKVEDFWIDRPDGGKFCVQTSIEPDFEPDEDRGFLGRRYVANGPMEFDPWIDSTPPVLDWHAWRLDNAWNQRTCKPWNRMKDEFAWLARHIHGDLSPEFNPDEYRALVENGWLEAAGDGSFRLRVVHVPAPGPAGNCPMVRLLPQPDEETLKAFSTFGKAYLDLVLPTLPARLRPLAAALHKDTATGHQMVGHILEHLEQTGKLKTPRQADRPGLQLVMWV